MWDITNIELDEQGDALLLSFPHNLQLTLLAETIGGLGLFTCYIRRGDDPDMEDVEILPPKNWGEGQAVDGGTLYTMPSIPGSQPLHTINVWEGIKRIQISNKMSSGEIYESIEMSTKEWLPVQTFLLWLQEQSVPDYVFQLEQQIRDLSPNVQEIANPLLTPPILNDMPTLLLGQRQNNMPSS